MANLGAKDQAPSLIAAGIAVAATSALITYNLTKKINEKKAAANTQRFQHMKRRESVKNIEAIQKIAEASLIDTSNDIIGTKIPDASIDDIYLWEVEHLGDYYESEAKHITNAMHKMNRSPLADKPTFSRVEESGNNKTQYNKLIGTHECILADLVRKPGQKPVCKAYVRAGARRILHFDPKNVNAAIVTCGGLCPGLNNVVRELTNSLVHLYNIGGKVWGIRGGYKGFYDPSTPPMELTPEVVENIHHSGGTILGSSRGGFDMEKILAFISKYKISQLYVIGGDGTHRGAFKIHEECMKIVSIPVFS